MITSGSRPRQDGMVLITSLIILLVLTLLGLAAVQNTSMEERMAGNMRRETIAFQAAETGLRAAEDWLFGLTAPPDPGKVIDGRKIWEFGPDDVADSPESVYKNTTTSWWQEWTDDDWNNRKGQNNATAASDTLYFTAEKSVLANPPHYVIERRAPASDSLVVGRQEDSTGGRTFYQITARGLDPTGRSEVIVRSTYARRF